MKNKHLLLVLIAFLSFANLNAQSNVVQSEMIVKGIEQKVIDWRRDIHQYPWSNI